VIRLGLDVAVAALFSAVILLILGVWFRGRGGHALQAGMEDDAAADVQQCPYCRRLCVDEQHKKVMICPVCKSYFDEEIE
jgi:hypothetical protein